MTIIISNPSSERNEKINSAVILIGKSKDTLEFFQAVYTKKNIVKTIQDILKMTSIKSVVRVLQVGKKLASHDIVHQIKDPKTKRTAYKKIDFYSQNKNTILSRVKKNIGSSGIRFRYTGNSIQRSQSNSKRKNNMLKKWDVFISHAHQDKTIAEPFVKKLKEMNVKVWYDKDVLRWGDSLMDSINRGLKDSLYGVVILSKTFFKKHWTKTELRALLSLSNARGGKKILPLFYKITHEEIVEEYPILADIVGRSWDDGIDNLAQEIKELIDEKKKFTTKNEPNATSFDNGTYAVIQRSDSKKAANKIDEIDKKFSQMSEEEILARINKSPSDSQYLLAVYPFCKKWNGAMTDEFGMKSISGGGAALIPFVENATGNVAIYNALIQKLSKDGELIVSIIKNGVPIDVEQTKEPLGRLSLTGKC